MIEAIVKYGRYIWQGLQMEMTILGYTFSWWSVFVFEIVSSILVYVIIGIIKDDD